jgi:hypothetical protein
MPYRGEINSVDIGESVPDKPLFLSSKLRINNESAAVVIGCDAYRKFKLRKGDTVIVDQKVTPVPGNLIIRRAQHGYPVIERFTGKRVLRKYLVGVITSQFRAY